MGRLPVTLACTLGTPGLEVELRTLLPYSLTGGAGPRMISSQSFDGKNTLCISLIFSS